MSSDNPGYAHNAEYALDPALKEQAIRFARATTSVERTAIDRWAFKRATARDWNEAKYVAALIVAEERKRRADKG